MSAGSENELISFQQFVAQQLNGPAQISPEEALDRWRAEHPDEGDMADSVLGLREALADTAAGDAGIPLADFDREFRARRKLDGR